MRAVLILMGRYLPGYKDGGPLRSIVNLTERLGNEYDFKIITTDRDHGDKTSYQDILCNEWNQVGKAKVWYVKPGGFLPELIVEKAAEANVVYICGCFNDYARVALKLKKQGRIKAKLVVASMGLFSPGAFGIKYLKKKLYIELMKAGGYFKKIEWSATDAAEVSDIRRIIGRKAKCCIAQDLPSRLDTLSEPATKTEEGLRVIFLSRISRKKNLSYALEVLREIKDGIIFDIYGVMEDKEYFSECTRLINKLPANVKADYKGEVSLEEVPKVFSQYQVFLFPTLGENYGHVIYEALAGGCIPVISDRTPWGELEKEGVGRAISLEAKEVFVQALHELAEFSAEECLERQKKAMAYAKTYSDNIDCSGYRAIFDAE